MALEKHLLILEDNLEILDILKDVFTEEGYRVTGITASEDIITTVREIKPDLILTDYILDGINGGEYCHQVKTEPSTAHIPVIILSAYPMVLGSLGNYGADAIVSKPFDIRNLSDTVAGVLKGHRAS